MSALFCLTLSLWKKRLCGDPVLSLSLWLYLILSLSPGSFLQNMLLSFALSSFARFYYTLLKISLLSAPGQLCLESARADGSKKVLLTKCVLPVCFKQGINYYIAVNGFPIPQMVWAPGKPHRKIRWLEELMFSGFCKTKSDKKQVSYFLLWFGGRRQRHWECMDY